MLADQPVEQGEHGPPGLDVQVPGRLVRKQQRRVMDQCPGNRHALLFPAGQLVGKTRAAVGQPHRVQEFSGPPDLRRAAVSVQFQRQADVFRHGQRGDEVVELEDEADLLAPEQGPLALGQPCETHLAPVHAHTHVPAGRQIDAADQIQQRRFSRPAAPEQHHALSRGDLCVEPAEDRTRVRAFFIDLGQVAQTDERRIGGFHCPAV